MLTCRYEIAKHEYIGGFEVQMDLVFAVAVAQTGNDLSGNDFRLVHRRSSPGSFHLLDPVDEATTGAVLHNYEAHGAKCPFWHVPIEKIDESDHIRVI